MSFKIQQDRVFQNFSKKGDEVSYGKKGGDDLFSPSYGKKGDDDLFNPSYGKKGDDD